MSAYHIGQGDDNLILSHRPQKCRVRVRLSPPLQGRGAGYSFTLPAEMPLMIYLEKKQKAIMMGTAEMATTR